ncbi:MAG: SCO1664 family protein [Acidimicrobiales bacterium]|nr:SCO1664 family protein [Acidimicrobiales bacterium]
MPTEGVSGAGTEAIESPFRSRPPIDDSDAEEVLRCGEVDVLGRMPWSSNATFLVDVRRGDHLLQGVYKPGRGERPLHDFPPGLFRREAAAWELARQLGWGLIPPTVVRDGPLGEGSFQLYIPCDYDQHFFTLRDDPDHVAALQRLAAFDLVANSADRKGGHVLLGDDGGVWAVDNALCFHHQFKVRTVIWDWGGEPLADDLLVDLGRLADNGLSESLAALLDPFERDAVLTRAAALGEDGVLPFDPTGRRIPWPLL